MADPYDLNNIALRRRAIADGRAVVVRPINREALRKALGYHGPIPDDAVFWTTNQLYAALVRLGVAKE